MRTATLPIQLVAPPPQRGCALPDHDALAHLQILIIIFSELPVFGTDAAGPQCIFSAHVVGFVAHAWTGSVCVWRPATRTSPDLWPGVHMGDRRGGLHTQHGLPLLVAIMWAGSAEMQTYECLNRLWLATYFWMGAVLDILGCALVALLTGDASRGHECQAPIHVLMALAPTFIRAFVFTGCTLSCASIILLFTLIKHQLMRLSLPTHAPRLQQEQEVLPVASCASGGNNLRAGGGGRCL